MDLGALNYSSLAAFAVASIAIELTPGPNMVWLALIAITDGRRAGFAAVAGVFLGLALVAVAVALGLGAVVADSPDVYHVLRLAGIAYLLWLAWEAWQSGAQVAGEMQGTRGNLAKYFARGLITNILNPKAFLFYVSVLPAFLPPAPVLADTAALGVIYVMVATLIHGGIVAAAGSARGVLIRKDRMQFIGRSAAAILVALALWLWFKT
jgi:threonine/homoserine/homoserine lactone efflux protein